MDTSIIVGQDGFVESVCQVLVTVSDLRYYLSLKCADEYGVSTETLRGRGAFYKVTVATQSDPQNKCSELIVDLVNSDIETKSNANKWWAEVGYWPDSEWSDDEARWFCRAYLSDATFSRLHKAIKEDSIGRVTIVLDIKFVICEMMYNGMGREYVPHYVCSSKDKYEPSKSIGTVKSVSAISAFMHEFKY